MKQVVIYRCRNSGGSARLFNERGIREKVLACGAQLEELHLLRAFEGGAGGVCVVLCPEERCASISGGQTARRRIEHTLKLLSEVDVEEGRLKLIVFEDERSLRSDIIDFQNALDRSC